MRWEILNSTIADRNEDSNSIETIVHLTLEIRPNRYVIKAKIVTDKFGGNPEISYTLPANIHKSSMYLYADYTGERKQELEDFIMSVLKEMADN